MNRLFLLLTIFFTCNSLKAQIDKEFWFAIPKETSGHGSLTAANNVSFKITAMQLDAKVTISMPANPAFVPRTFTVPAEQSRIEILATNFNEFANIFNNSTTNGAIPLSGKTNRGFLITADNDISVYYDFNNIYNSEFFTLKGRNALGTEFYTPFQNIWANGTNYIPRAYSSIEIVATEDGTEIDIYPTTAIQGFTFPGTIHISLNRGEAYSLRANGATATDHASGTKIVSNKKIAITINDDSVRGANITTYDIIGDQLIPTNLLGTKYLALSGSASQTHAGGSTKDILRGEQIFVTATQPGTQITFKGIDGSILYTTILNAGQVDYFSTDIVNSNQNSILIESNDTDKPFYVLHITGIGGEIGGTILPPITGCNGSNKVIIATANSRSKSSINLFMPYDKALPFNDPSQAHNFFKLYNSIYPTGYSIPSDWFEPNIEAGFAVLKMSNRDFSALLNLSGTNKFENTQNLFHLGMTNGSIGVTNKYGYFSSFGTNKSEVSIAGEESTDFITCYGQKFKLLAKGGSEYAWHYGTPMGPATYISDPKSTVPEIAGCPAGNHKFYVEIKTWCSSIDTFLVNVDVMQNNISAQMSINASTICAPELVNIKNNSINGSVFAWTKQIDNGNPELIIPSNDNLFQESLQNASGLPIKVKYKLYAENTWGCTDSTSKEVTVYPQVNADYTVSNSSGCNPLNVQFNYNQSSADTYLWDFGDGTISANKNPSHEFLNYSSKDTSYTVKLIATSPYQCIDTVSRIITVYPKPKAIFATDNTQGLSPFSVSFVNLSKEATSYLWDFGDSIVSNTENPVHVFQNTNSSPIYYNVTLKASNNINCSDSVSETITVYPEVIADFSQDTTFGRSPLSIQFYNKSINAASISWRFGDNSYSSELNPSHQFINNSDAPVDYTVQLMASNNYGSIDSVSVVITVLPACKTTASFNVEKIEGPSPIIVSFISTSTNAASLLWDFDDNTTSTHQNPVHAFPNSTIATIEYNVKLKAFHPHCGVDSTSMIVLIHPERIIMGDHLINNSGFKLYPNPTKDIVNIEYTLDKPMDVSIEVVESTGKILNRTMEHKKFQGPNASSIDLSNLRGSLFFIKITLDGKTKVVKVYKN